LRFTTRITKSRLASEMNMFNISALKTLIRGESEGFGSAVQNFIDSFERYILLSDFNFSYKKILDDQKEFV
jgi:hypothetical protein